MDSQQNNNIRKLLTYLRSRPEILSAIEAAREELVNIANRPLRFQRAIVNILARAVYAVLEDIREAVEDPLHDVVETQLGVQGNNMDRVSRGLATDLATRYTPEIVAQLNEGVKSLEAAVKKVTIQQSQCDAKPKSTSAAHKTRRVKSLTDALPAPDSHELELKNKRELKRSVSHIEKTSSSKTADLHKQHSKKRKTIPNQHHIERRSSKNVDVVNTETKALHRSTHKTRGSASSMLSSASAAKHSIAQIARTAHNAVRLRQFHQEEDEAVNIMERAIGNIGQTSNTINAAEGSPTSEARPYNTRLSAQELKRQRSTGQRSSAVDRQK